jgi:hypothetical protein
MSRLEIDDPRHGSYAGSQAHRRQGIPLCTACKAAESDYMAAYRKRPGKRRAENVRNAARSRALWLLADKYPDEFERLYVQEVSR